MPELTHVVLLAIKPSADPGDVCHAVDAIRGLAAIDGVRSVLTGRDVSVAGLSEDFTHGVVVEFADEHARDRYGPHPVHQEVLAHLEPLIDRKLIVDIARPSFVEEKT